MDYFNLYKVSTSVLDLPVGYEFINVIFALILGVVCFYFLLVPVMLVYRLILSFIGGGK